MTLQRRSEGGRPVLLVGAVAGLIAGMMMAMVEMIYGWLSSTHSFWDAPMAIWAWVAGIDHFGQPANHIGPIVLGLAGHMMNSIVIGVVFALLVLATRVRGVAVTVMLGVVYGLVVWALMRYAILPLRSGEEHLFTTSTVSPQWVWWVSHAILGMTLGALTAIGLRRVAMQERVSAPSSTYRDPHPVS